VKLGELQAIFAEALVKPSSIACESDWPVRGDAAFTGSARLSPIEQLDVYREQFWLRHIGCLAEDFPTLQALVGEARFDAIVADYLAAHPPVHFQLRHLGDHLASFLAKKEDSLLADVARLEWAYIDAFDAEDAPPLDPREVQTIAPDEWATVRILFHPSLQLLRLSHPTHLMRDAQRGGQSVSKPEPKPTHLGIYRRDLLLYTEEMEPLPFALLESLAHGEQLGPAGDAVASSEAERTHVEVNIGTWFTRWSALGWIVGVRALPPA
jgi:hypothetical protein